MKNKPTSVSVITKIGLFTAVAVILNMLEFPLWFAPDYYKFDFSSAVALLGSYFIGPMAGIIIAVLKTVLKALIMGSTSALVGEYVDIIITIIYIFPAAVIFRNSTTKRSVISGMSLGVISMSLFGCLLNYFLLIPIYARIIGVPIDTLVASAALTNRYVIDLRTLVFFITAPFNVFKGVCCSFVAYLCHIPLKKITKMPERSDETD